MNPPQRKLRWGVLGYARIARVFLIPAIQKARNSELVAVASRDLSTLDGLGTSGVTARRYGSYDALLQDREVEAVYIPLPNSMHCEWTIKAAEQGKHVLCEKPIGLNTAEARRMIAACEANGVTLMEAFMYRYTTRTAKVLEIVRSGALGEIRQVNASFRFLLNRPSIKLHRDLGGGSLYDVGCYPVNFIGMIADALAGGLPGAGGKPEIIAAEAEMRDGIDIGFSALLRYPSGLRASIQSGFNTHLRIFAEILGSQGGLEVPEFMLDDGRPLVLATTEGRREVEFAPCDRYLLEVEDFADAVLNRRPPAFSLVETVRNMELIDALLAAAKY